MMMLLMELDPARTHNDQDLMMFTRVYSQTKLVQRPYKSRKETTSVRQQSHPKQCITMPWHQGHSVITCVTIAHHVWLPSWNRYSHTHSKHFLIFSCDQAALQMVFSVCPSVCPSVRPSVCHTFFTMFPSSYHHEIFRSYYHGQKWCPCKSSRSEVKGQGNRDQHPT